jgi:hypothetical protein
MKGPAPEAGPCSFAQILEHNTTLRDKEGSERSVPGHNPSGVSSMEGVKSGSVPHRSDFRGRLREGGGQLFPVVVISPLGRLGVDLRMRIMLAL